MATMAQRLTAAPGAVAVRQGGSRKTIHDPALADALVRAHALARRLSSIESELSDAKTIIAERAEGLRGEGSTVSLEARGTRCTVTVRHEAVIPEENVRELRGLLGRRFRDLVRTRVRHMATSRLIGEADGETLGLIRLRRLSPRFRWDPGESPASS